MPVSADEARAQLARIVASPGFASADRMSAFLTYVVERALAGEGSQVKEYTVGVDVFGRPAGYDPRVDSIVRVEARRLRTKLDEYYAGEGAGDPVVIRMPRGGYVPTFDTADARPASPAPAVPRADTVPVGSVPVAPAPRGPDVASPRRLNRGTAIVMLILAAIAVAAAAWRTNGRPPAPAVTLAVLPFEQYSADQSNRLLAERLTDGVTRELARTRQVGVVSHTSAVNVARDGRRASEIGQALGADILVEGSVERKGDRFQIWVRLVSVATDRKIWVEEFATDGVDLEPVERAIAAAVAPAALSPTTTR